MATQEGARSETSATTRSSRGGADDAACPLPARDAGLDGEPVTEPSPPPLHPYPPEPEQMWEQTFPGTAEQIRHVRAALRTLLSDCPMVDDVILVVSELSANAVAHSASGKPGGKFTVRLQHLRGEYVWGEVEDDGSRWDGSLEDSARNASGLFFVLHLASECGVAYGTERNRVVWFRKQYPAGDHGAVALDGAMRGACSNPAAAPGWRTQPCTRAYDVVP